MRVLGIIIDASKETPLPDAKLSFHIGEKELAVLYSDSEGRFEHKEEISYLGETLICQVEKESYKPQKVTHKIEQEEVQLEMKLVPEKEEKLEFQLECKDDRGNPIGGVSVSLEIDGEGVGIGISDKNGLFKITLSPDFKDKTLNFKAELGGFELGKGEVKIGKETSCDITMKKIPVTPPRKIWPKIVLGTAAVIVIVIIISIAISRKPSPPRRIEPPYKVVPVRPEKIQPKATVPGVNLYFTDFQAQYSGGTLRLQYWLRAEGRLNRAFNMGILIRYGSRREWVRRWGLPSPLIDRLKNGETITQDIAVQIPNWGEGRYSISIHADVDNYVNERNEDDNAKEKRLDIVN